MNKLSILTNTFFALILAVWMNTDSFAEPANLSHLRNEVIVYHDSGDYQREIARVIAHARSYILARAEENLKSKHPKKLAIVLDIDETSLSTYDYMVIRDFVGSRDRIHQEIMEANAPPIKPVLALYREAQAHDIAIFFVTGRFESERQATEKNLKQAGYQHWTKLYCRPPGYQQTSIVPFKSASRAEIEKNYTVIASIGDQYSDLNGGHAAQTFKLPNPYYYLP